MLGFRLFTAQSESPFIIHATKSREINSASSNKRTYRTPNVSFHFIVDIAVFS
jgi:hypothetical protein